MVISAVMLTGMEKEIYQALSGTNGNMNGCYFQEIVTLEAKVI